MYATRPLSLYQNFPGARSEKPPSAPYSGHLVLTDGEAESENVFCWGILKNKRVTELPFPQDKIMKIVNPSDHEKAYITKVWFIPVLDQPLSANRYYVIKAAGKYKGLACTCSREDDIAGCCLRDAIANVRPTSFNHKDIYQQFEIHRYINGGFYAKSVAGDGFPPKFLRRKGWKVYASTSLQLKEAQGLNFSSIQNPLPSIKFPMYYKCSPPIVLATWHCPFVFVKEKDKISNRVGISLWYEMTLQQWWEEIYYCGNEGNADNRVSIEASIKGETILVYGLEGLIDESHLCDDGFVWFKGVGVGLSLAIIEKMRWIEEQRGWVGGVERVERVVEVRGGGEWKRFSCYVLVESFVLKRMDGVVLVSWKFRHTNRTKCKWE